MKALLLTSLALTVLASFFIFSEQQASAVPIVFNQTALNIPWTIVPRATPPNSFDIFLDSGYNGTITAWYRIQNNNTLNIHLGTGHDRTLFCNPIAVGAIDTWAAPSNGSNIYYYCETPNSIYHITASNGTSHHDMGVNIPIGAGRHQYIFPEIKNIVVYASNNANGQWTRTALNGGNTTLTSTLSTVTAYSDMQVGNTANNNERWNNNSTSVESTNWDTQGCALTFRSNNATTPIDTIACDPALPATAVKYWNGMLIQKTNIYTTNSTLSFFNSINSNPYKKMLTLASPELNIGSPHVSFILHANATNYLVELTSTNVYYADVNTVNAILNSNRAIQTYMTILPNTDSSYALAPSSINPTQPMKFYGPNTNTTVNKYGMFTVASGYTTRDTAISESTIRTVDPQWTNDISHDLPIIHTDQALFPVILTVSNAPTDAAIKVTNPYQIINNQEALWSVTRLDSTHTAEFDIPLNQCPNVYVADNSIQPYVYIFEGTVCATGTNQKTIAYTATLPTSFYTQKYGATHSFTPANNGLVVTTRASTTPYTYNVIIKNSTGAITQNFTKTVNGNIDIQNFNTTNATKSASLYVSIVGVGQIYQANLGSPLSFASTVAFFHQYFNYQGFDMLSFIPIIFASMFTRSTVGIGTALTVVCIASLSWLSIVVVPDTIIYVSIIIAIITMVGYRGYQYFG